MIEDLILVLICLSQSLPLFRAFQHKYDLSFPFIIELSQSLPLFRAFQQEKAREFVRRRRESRNPFLYSGHFNKTDLSLCNRFTFTGVAIPSFIQGISTDIIPLLICLPILPVAIPSFIQGISTGGHTFLRRILTYPTVAIPSFIQGISTRRKILLSLLSIFMMSQSLPLFRAFQPAGNLSQFLSFLLVAIPSFIQGISTSLGGESWNMVEFFVAIPSFIQGIST